MDDLEHPLFPAKDENDDPPQIGKISIARFDPVKGTSPFIPRMFDAKEILDLSQISEMYGGGRYELVGRNAEGNRIVAKRVYDIAGPSKPLVAEVPPVETAPVYHPPAAPAQASQMNMATVLPIVVPIVLQYLQNAAADRREQQAQSQAMTMAMMQQQQASSQAFIQAMSTLPQRSGGGSSEEFRAGIQFAENLIEAKMAAANEAGGGEADAGEIMKTIGQAFEMLKLTGGSSPPAGSGA
jgi:hypothetical protein